MLSRSAVPFGLARISFLAAALLVVWSVSCSTGGLPPEECPDGATGEDCVRDTGPDPIPDTTSPDTGAEEDTSVDTDPDDTGSACEEPCGEGEKCVDGGCVSEGCEGAGCPCLYSDTENGVCSEGETDEDGKCTPPENYEQDETACDDVDNDCDGVTDEQCNCDYNGNSEGVCSEGVVGDTGDCGEPEDYEDPEQSCDGLDNDCDGDTDEPGPNNSIECSPGDQETQSCSQCGEKVRNCKNDCTWEAWSDCQNQGVCTPGDTQMGSCGNCGDRSRTCKSDCSWGSWSVCSNEGVCSPGDTDPSGCPSCRAKECKNNCEWTSECSACTCSSFQQCGTSCPDGYHVASSSCDFSCSGDCSSGDNARFCEPNCGTSFTSCESSCPTGYSQDRTKCDSSCPGDCTNSDNAIVCVEN